VTEESDSRPITEDYARLDGKVASLSAALLARKGAAAPSLKRFAREKPRNPFSSPCAADAASCSAREARRGKRRASLTLRLPIPDFLRLKLASAEFERTSQAILLDALRAYLDDRDVENFDDCPCLRKAAAAEEAQSR
jgi:hypothetical protein